VEFKKIITTKELGNREFGKNKFPKKFGVIIPKRNPHPKRNYFDLK